MSRKKSTYPCCLAAFLAVMSVFVYNGIQYTRFHNAFNAKPSILMSPAEKAELQPSVSNGIYNLRTAVAFSRSDLLKCSGIVRAGNAGACEDAIVGLRYNEYKLREATQAARWYRFIIPPEISR